MIIALVMFGCFSNILKKAYARGDLFLSILQRQNVQTPPH